MVYRKAKQKVRRAHSRSKTLFGGDFLKNPYFVGIVAGAVKNALAGKKIIDVENIKSRISKMDGTNPLILLSAGILAKNPLITAIGLFGIVDPPDDAEKKEEYIGYSNVGETQENAEYSNVGETQENAEYSNVGETQENAEYSNAGETQENAEYSNIGETQEITKKRFAY
ncbi:MAG: hypothetical protein CO124_00415 [Candidatus Huberarchaeum crystalense]|uniref:Uncharacterized protein n=1 Tax=Huberarchaeum crystalense TaxID=2014257 RepID=A0A2H9QSR2_HUBC1|nr:MAG: hypothetical protein CO124_00415 [Candidatus Huberarchaeum crystalense]